MTRAGRSFPLHTVTEIAPISNYTITLRAISPVVALVAKGPTRTLSIISNTVNTISAMKLGKLIILSVASSVSSSLLASKGKGIIVSATSSVAVSITKGIRKIVSISSSTSGGSVWSGGVWGVFLWGVPGLVNPGPGVKVVASTSKGIGKSLGTSAGTTPTFILEPKIILSNYDGGVSGSPSTTTLPISSTQTIAPGLFKVVAPKGLIKVQFRQSIINIVKRIMTGR